MYQLSPAHFELRLEKYHNHLLPADLAAVIFGQPCTEVSPEIEVKGKVCALVCAT